MAEVLFLAHRIPYPPDKGDKIRSWHLLRHLASRHTVSLGCFVDDPEDWQHTNAFEGLIAESKFCSVPRSPMRLSNVAAFWRGLPISVQHYRSREMSGWVDEISRRRKFEVILAFSSNIAQFAMQRDGGATRRVIDFVDVDSHKWRQFAETRPWPFRYIYRRESRILAEHDRSVAAAFDASLFVSAREADLFGRLAPGSAHKISVLPNGIDADFFDPALSHVDPFPHTDAALVFTGAMDYWANVDAVEWFAESIFPIVRSAHSRATFWIVGANPTKKVLHLGRIPGVTVTGRVDDVRPYLAHASAVVAPLRIARGVQNKVLEGMSMGRPVVATSAAVGGITDIHPDLDVLVAETAHSFAACITALLEDPVAARELGERGRSRIVENHSWRATLKSVDGILGLCGAGESFAWARMRSR